MVLVELFPTQTETDCLYLIVVAPTGVVYHNQCGGTGCDQKEAEGFLVPIGNQADTNKLSGWFRKHFGESCWCDGRLASDPALVRDLATVVAELPCFFAGKAIRLCLDEVRVHEGCEAWVPVKSPYGPGWLTFTNSD
jgi:hypothetical protein